MYIDEFFEKAFFKKLDLDYHRQLLFGQFFWTHAYYPHEHVELWRPVPDPNEPTKTRATSFRIESAGTDAFHRSLPLHVPKLETNEEFLVIRAKRRPVVLVLPPAAPMGVESKGYPGKVQRPRCLVAQVFGLADARTGDAQFPQSFVDRVRQMEFPELMFLPQHPGLLEVDSLLRLDELQSVFEPQLEAKQYALADEVAAILRGQLLWLFGLRETTNFTTLREMLLKR